MEAYSHVLSTSLINARKAGTFNGNGGIVLSATSRVLCAYPYDGGAMNYDNGCGPFMCSPDDRWGCAFPLSMLDVMMRDYENRRESAYNEVVVDAAQFRVEAVFGGAAAAGTHAALLAHYGVSSRELPLLVLSGRPRDPFDLAVT